MIGRDIVSCWSRDEDEGEGYAARRSFSWSGDLAARVWADDFGVSAFVTGDVAAARFSAVTPALTFCDRRLAERGFRLCRPLDVEPAVFSGR